MRVRACVCVCVCVCVCTKPLSVPPSIHALKVVAVAASAIHDLMVADNHHFLPKVCSCVFAFVSMSVCLLCVCRSVHVSVRRCV